MLIGALFSIGMIPLVGQLNSNVAGLGSPGPSSIVLTCNTARHTSDLVLWHFYCTFYKLEACFHLTMALMVV